MIGSILYGAQVLSPVLGKLLQPLAIGAAASAMGYWATTNLYQTSQISDDQRKQLEWSREKFYLEQEASDLEYQQDLSKIALVGAFDELDDYRQMAMQNQRLQTQSDIASFEAEQENYERNLYLEERAFTQSTGQSLTALLGEEKSLGKLIFLRDELKKQLPNANILQIPNDISDYNDHYENPENHWPL